MPGVGFLSIAIAFLINVQMGSGQTVGEIIGDVRIELSDTELQSRMFDACEYTFDKYWNSEPNLFQACVEVCGDTAVEFGNDDGSICEGGWCPEEAGASQCIMKIFRFYCRFRPPLERELTCECESACDATSAEMYSRGEQKTSLEYCICIVRAAPLCRPPRLVSSHPPMQLSVFLSVKFCLGLFKYSIFSGSCQMFAAANM